MNRNEEYRALLRELETTPPALDTAVERALKRHRAARKRRLWGIPVGSLAACFALFVGLVNAFPTFAAACEDVPVLGALAEAVRFSPSLSAAVEHDYVQPVGQSQTKNGITATVESIIVDQKQVNIFFTLDYVDQDVPDGFTMTFSVTGQRAGEQQETPAAPDRAIEDEMLAPSTEPEAEILAEFTFDLTFDPQFTAQGEVLAVNETFTLDGQTFTLTEAEIYPTHLRINVEGAEDNTAWLKGLEFYLENEDGERFDAVSGGVTASGDTDSPAMVSYRLESPWFSGSDHLTVHITGAKWLAKEHQRVYVDLEHGTAPWLPDGVSLTSAQRREDGWVLTFRLDGALKGSPFSMTFYDAEGNPWDARQMGMTFSDDEQAGSVMLPLPDYQAGEVWLTANYSHETALPENVEIPLK